jgi:inosine/xanthosine triphosphatase
MKIIVGSKNPVKIESVREAFSKYFDAIEIESLNVESGVPDQPIGDDTFRGARNRARNLMQLKPGFDFYIGIEGGIAQQFGKWFAFGCMCIIDENGDEAFGTSPHFELPQKVTNNLLEGKELGDVMDELMNTQNSKHKDGAIGFFTNGVMNRKELYLHGLIVALAPFVHKNLYFKDK